MTSLRTTLRAHSMANACAESTTGSVGTRTAALLLVAMLAANTARAQMPRDTARFVYTAGQEVGRIGRQHGVSIWPGFRPDTIPLSFVLPSRGDVLLGWKAALPAGYAEIPGLPGAAWRAGDALGAASTAITIGSHPVAQIVVQQGGPAMLVATATHEAFHVFQAASRKEGQRFGRGENSILVARYPAFDVENEAGLALEGVILAAALDARTTRDKRALAREFVAERRARQRRLPAEFAEFETLGELNEGLADYALVRALDVEAHDGPTEWRAEAERALHARHDVLADLTGAPNVSLRLRFYYTGSAQALLLDALAGPRWKAEMVATNSTLQDMLAVASGLDDQAIAARRSAESRLGFAALRRTAGERVERLKAGRLARVDSVLSGPGVRLVLSADSLPGRDFNPCGYDPQNLLQVTPAMQLHTRWWKPCAGSSANAEFNVPSVHDATAGTVSAMIGPDSTVRLFAGDQRITLRDGETLRDVRALRLEAPRATATAARADVSRQGSTIRIRPKSP